MSGDRSKGPGEMPGSVCFDKESRLRWVTWNRLGYRWV